VQSSKGDSGWRARQKWAGPRYEKPKIAVNKDIENKEKGFLPIVAR